VRLITCLLTTIAVLTMAYGVGPIYGFFQTNQTKPANTFSIDKCWTQTTQGDFEASGQQSNVDTSTVPGDVRLYNSALSGNLKSIVFDTGNSNTQFDSLSWNSTLPAGTTITFQIRASNKKFNVNDNSIPWTNLTGLSPVSTGLPTGRYVQWYVFLTTKSMQVTPALHSVDLWYH